MHALIVGALITGDADASPTADASPAVPSGLLSSSAGATAPSLRSGVPST